MKNQRLIIIFISFITTITLGQSPQGFGYQAEIRNNNGDLLVNQQIGVLISIIEGSAAGNTSYEETHTITTSNLGKLTLQIGTGNSTVGDFSTIPWGENTFFMEVGIDTSGGSNFVVISNAQILSVPYALQAREVEIGDNWGNQIVESSGILEGDGTTNIPIRISNTDASGRYLRSSSNGGEAIWSNLGAHSINGSGSVPISTDWVSQSFANTQFGGFCVGGCKVLIRYYSPVDVILMFRQPGNPNPVRDIYEIKAGQSVLIFVQAENGVFEYRSNINVDPNLEFVYIEFFE